MIFYSKYAKSTHRMFFLINLDIIFQDSKDGGLQVELEFFAYKEKLVKEKIHLIDPDGKNVSVIIFARILG